MEGDDVTEWLEDMFAKVEGMWSDLRQTETVNYVENRVQSIENDVENFFSEFIQEIFSCSPAQTMSDQIVDAPPVQITETVYRIRSTKEVSNEILSVEIPEDSSEESISVKGEMLAKCENKECLYAKNCCACGASHPILEELPITNIPDAASSSELVDVSAGNSKLREWDYMGYGSCEEIIKCETMLDDESCIMINSNDPRTNKHHSKNALDLSQKNLKRKPSLSVDMVKNQDSLPADESSSSGHSTWHLEMFPLAPEVELIEQDWEIV